MPNQKLSFVFSFLVFSVLLILTICALSGNRLFLSAKTSNSVPTAPSVTVILDPGHGGEDGGANNGTVYEKDLNLSIAMETAELLRLNGISVICTRTEDILLYDKNTDYKGRKKILDLAARLKISRETASSVFVSIHMNAFPQTQYQGLQVYYSDNDHRSSVLAQSIQESTKMLLQNGNNRKIKKAGSNIFLLDRIQTPAVLVECGFLSNTEECEKLASTEYRKKLSLILTNAIVQFVENTY